MSAVRDTRTVREVLESVLGKVEKTFCLCTNGGKRRAKKDCSICKGTGTPRLKLIQGKRAE